MEKILTVCTKIKYLITLSLFIVSTCDNKRPFYIIGHNANRIENVTDFLDKGANVIETDIQFHKNGSVKAATTSSLKDFLLHIRNITEPNTNGSYSEKMIMQYFDLSLKKSENKTQSGVDIASHILDYLWSEDESRKHEVRALIYIADVGNADVIKGCIEEFRSRGDFDRMKKYVGFDGGQSALNDIRKMFEELEVVNVWQGHTISKVAMKRTYKRIKQAMKVRDSPRGYIKKVYYWTISTKKNARNVLKLGLDGIITFKPENIMKVIEEDEFKEEYRIATPNECPFAKYRGYS